MKKISFLILLLLPSINAGASKIGTVDIHGFISQGYLQSDENNYLADTEDGTFQFNEMGVNFVTKVSPNLRIGIQLFARDLGELGNDEITLDWAFADYQWKDWIGLRVGMQKVNMGFYNTVRDLDMLRTCILLPQGVYNESWRDSYQSFKGIGLYGTRFFGPLGSFSYNAQLGLFSVDIEGGVAKVIRSSGLVDTTDAKVDTAWTGNLVWSLPVDGLRIGYSILRGDIKLTGEAMSTFTLLTLSGQNPYGIEEGDIIDVEGDDNTNQIFSIEYSLGNFVLATEYTIYSGKITTNAISFTNRLLGYYYSGSYRFNDWFELGLYYSVFYNNENDKKGEDYAQQRVQPNALEMVQNPPSWFKTEYLFQPAYNAFLKNICLSLRFDINNNWTFKLEGHAMHGAYGADPLENLPTEDNPDGTVEDWFLFATKISYYF